MRRRGEATPQLVGVRFPQIPLANGAIIKKAYIQFELDATAKNTDPFSVAIWAENTDSASTYTNTASTDYELTSRTKSTDSIVWNIPSGAFNTVDEKYNTSDIKTLVQQLVNRTGWKSGNAMAFYIKGKGTREVEAYEGEPEAAASIVIVYDTTITKANNLVEADYTIPSWTLMKRALTMATATPDSTNLSQLELAVANLKTKETPFSVNMTINGDPTSRMGFSWFTNQGIDKGTVQIVAGKASDATAFASPAFIFDADSTNYTTNYCVSANGLLSAAGFANNSKRSYSTHKAIATGLQANTTYSFRVGVDGGWSEIGSFTTAKAGKDAFSFIYFTDPQANTDDMFTVSQKTTHAAKIMYPDANFALTCGDLVETSGSSNAEWEYEQFFSTQQDIWNTTPMAPVMGNHDNSSNKNFTKHFNTAVTTFDKNLATVPGSVYSFVYGDALFMAMEYEDYAKTAYLDSLKAWMKQQVAANPDVKWKIAFYHKTMYTGSASHQSDADGKIICDYFTPVFDSLKIDLALQGHDHVYEVIGPLKGKALVAGAVTNQVISTPTTSTTVGSLTTNPNVTGKWGGTFDVKEGTLYFLNNSGGKKKYQPRTEAQMDAAETALGLTDYFSFFTGRFGQTGEPTFSNISVTSDSINIATYTVDDNGIPTLFDNFKVVKTADAGSVKNSITDKVRVYPNPAGSTIIVDGLDQVDGLDLYNVNGSLAATVSDSNTISVKSLNDGMYMLKVKSGDESIVKLVIVKK